MNEREIMKHLKKSEFRVVVFGSARLDKKDLVYKKIYKLGKMLGERGMDVITGGGPGAMEAASLGHKEGRKKTKAHSIGLGIKLPHEQKFNGGVDLTVEFNRFSKRLDNFMLLANVVVVAPGGVGTLLELMYTWQLVQVQHICNIPIILLGDTWKGLVNWLEREPLRRGYFEKKDLNLLFVAKNPREAMKMIDKAHEEFKRGNDSYCLNYEKYKLY